MPRAAPDATAPVGETAAGAPPVALAASAGGIQAVRVVLQGLPRDFPAAVIVVEHLLADHPSFLAPVLGRDTPLPVKQAEHDELLLPGTVYVAPPDHHTTVQGGCILLDEGPLVSYVRPSATNLFASLARAYGRSAVVAVLTGSGADGATGARLVRNAGGTVIVQDPRSAEFSGMPAAAVAAGAASLVLPLGEIAAALCASVAAAEDA